MTQLQKHLVAAALVFGFACSAQACQFREFAFEGLFSPSQNTPEICFQELQAFAVGQGFPAKPIFDAYHRRIETGLNGPIDLTGFAFAVVHYEHGTANDPTTAGGLIAFYYIGTAGIDCQFAFPPLSPAPALANGPISSIDLFKSRAVPDSGTSSGLLAAALFALAVLHWRSVAIRGLCRSCTIVRNRKCTDALSRDQSGVRRALLAAIFQTSHCSGEAPVVAAAIRGRNGAPRAPRLYRLAIASN